jgi:RimJ/RimL family protein N-acetyltransferase
MVVACIPRRMKEGNIRLRPLRIFDGPFMRHAFRQREVFEPNGLSEPIERSWFDVWWCLKRAFVFSYCIEIDSRPSGFVGFSNFSPGRYAVIALSLFDRQTRGRGYGTRVFAMLERILERHSLVEKLFARVEEDNQGAARFWEGIGFEIQESFRQEGVILMSREMRNSG